MTYYNKRQTPLTDFTYGYWIKPTQPTYKLLTLIRQNVKNCSQCKHYKPPIRRGNTGICNHYKKHVWKHYHNKCRHARRK